MTPSFLKRPGLLLLAAGLRATLAVLPFVGDEIPTLAGQTLAYALALGCVAVLFAMLTALLLGGRPLPALPFIAVSFILANAKPFIQALLRKEGSREWGVATVFKVKGPGHEKTSRECDS